MSRREASKKETRRLILEAARTLFAEKGMEECTMRDIAQKAGVSPASVVVHFSNKTALLEEALYGDIEKAVADLMSSLPESDDLFDCFVHISRGMFIFYDTNRDLYRSLLRLTLFEPASETPLMSKQSEEYVDFLKGLIEKNKARGVIRDTIDPLTSAASLFSLYIGALIILFRMPHVPTDMITTILTSMTTQYLEGITVSKP